MVLFRLSWEEKSLIHYERSGNLKIGNSLKNGLSSKVKVFNYIFKKIVMGTTKNKFFEKKIRFWK